jgi:hypothetical protein
MRITGFHVKAMFYVKRNPVIFKKYVVALYRDCLKDHFSALPIRV